MATAVRVTYCERCYLDRRPVRADVRINNEDLCWPHARDEYADVSDAVVLVQPPPRPVPVLVAKVRKPRQPRQRKPRAPRVRRHRACRPHGPREPKVYAPIACANPNCANVFTPTNGRHRYCSIRCFWQVRRGTVYESRICKAENCQKPFVAKRVDQLFCSATCRVGYWTHTDWYQKSLKHFAPKPCDHCGTLFTPKRGINRFCCHKCNHDWWKKEVRRRAQELQTTPHPPIAMAASCNP